MSTQDSAGGPEPSGELAELVGRWRRSAAEAENVRKRCARQVADERSAERARVAAAWLPVVDNLERAVEHGPDGDDPLVAGVRAVRDQALEVLAQLGFPRHAETSIAFDPYRHEAVGVVAPGGATPGTVVEVVRPGYGHGEHQLRPAAVLVAGDRTGGTAGEKG